jgi:ABC-type branched-subunit amino acid transport system substrate-binding protein
MKSFFDAYKMAYKEDPSFIAAQAYDSFKLLVTAIKKAIDKSDKAPTRENVHVAMESIKTFSGATGNFNLDENGDAVRQFQMYQIINGKMTSKK